MVRVGPSGQTKLVEKVMSPSHHHGHPTVTLWMASSRGFFQPPFCAKVTAAGLAIGLPLRLSLCLSCGGWMELVTPTQGF